MGRLFGHLHLDRAEGTARIARDDAKPARTSGASSVEQAQARDPRLGVARSGLPNRAPEAGKEGQAECAAMLTAGFRAGGPRAAWYFGQIAAKGLRDGDGT